MKFLQRLFAKVLCKHSKKEMVGTDLVLVKYHCFDCGKDIVEPYNGFKALKQHDRQ